MPSYDVVAEQIRFARLEALLLIEAKAAKGEVFRDGMHGWWAINVSEQNLKHIKMMNGCHTHATSSEHGQHLLVAAQPIDIIERRVAREHFEHNAPKTPPVGCNAVSTVLNDFWAHVEGAAHTGVGAPVLLH